jgi:hypothetical protein
VAAQYALGTVHQNARQSLGKRPRSIGGHRIARSQVSTEPYKAIGDLFSFSRAALRPGPLEAYAKAIELRPFYADAHVGLGDARAATGDPNSGAIKGINRRSCSTR